MIPVTLGLGLINVNAVVDTLFASRLIDPKLAPAAIDKAFRLYMLPQGMFSVAIATVLFPSLARLAARRDLDGFRHTVGLGIRQIAFLLIPASVISAVLAEPIVRLVYQRGAFEPGQTPVVAAALAAFSAGLTFNGTMLMLNRAFFSLQSNWIPTWVALGNLFVNGVLDAVFYRFGIWGFRSPRRSSTSRAPPSCSSCCAAGSGGSRRGRPRPRPCESWRPPPSSAPSRSASGTRSTGHSGARSRPSSSPSAPRSSPPRPRISFAAVCWAFRSFARC